MADEAPANFPKGDGRRVRTPTVLQLEATECGAAALGMVLASHGLWLTLEDLRVACGVSRDGSRAGNLLRVAAGHGMEARGFRTGLQPLRSMPMPAIVFVNLNHFLVLEGFKGKRVFLNDPAGGRRVLTFEEFDRIYSGIVLTFVPGPAFRCQGRRPPVLPRMLAWLDGSRGAVAYVVLAGVSLSFFAILAPSFTRIFVDQYLVGRQDGWVPWLLAAMAAAAAVQGGAVWARSAIRQRLTLQVGLRVSSLFVWRMLRLPIAFYARRFPGSVGARLEVSQDFSTQVVSLGAVMATDGVSALIFLAVMVGYSLPLAVMAAAIASLNIVVLLILQRRLEMLGQKVALDETKLAGRTMMGLQMIESLKASGADDPFFVAWSGQHSLVISARQDSGRLSALLTVMPDFLGQLGLAAGLMLGGWQVMHGQLTLGMLAGFQLLQLAFNAPVKTLMQGALQLMLSRGVLDQLDDVLQQPMAAEFSPPSEAQPDPRARAAASPRVMHRLSGQVSLRGLTFGYDPGGPPLIEGFDLEIPAGGRIAIVGASGSGKSTLGRLITGQFQPWSGEIMFEDVPLERVPRNLLRNSLAVVDQDVVLFEGTVRDNITLWDDTISEAVVVNAASDASIHDLIVSRPGSYATRVEEGGRNFSGGQRQRMEIARALVSSPTLLVLDEATSALDPLTEQDVTDKLRQRGCTCIIIAHRLSTIRDCDEIIVMHQGKVLERGAHDDLMALQGAYARLVDY
jgi:NHLM bacteriocin system ABC transporter peptidase/ATP-binding protein